MTGFARCNKTFVYENKKYSWAWEVKSVNAKGQDIKLRIPLWLEDINENIKSVFSETFSRGTFNVCLDIELENDNPDVEINTKLLYVLTEKLKQIYNNKLITNVTKFDYNNYYYFYNTTNEIFGIEKSISINEYHLISSSYIEKKIYDNNSSLQPIYEYLFENSTYPFKNKKSKLLIIDSIYPDFKEILLSFFKDYADSIYDNYFSISGKRLVVYLDSDDNGEYDEVETWTDTQKQLAQELVFDILNKVSSLNGSHATELSNIVSEINGSARAKFEDNPIAPENEWAKYRKVGLNVALEDVTATNDTTDIDFALKQRLYDIYNSPNYSINDTAPTEYLEDLENNSDILVTKDGYNLLLATSASFKTTAEFTEEDDALGLFQNINVYYNEKYEIVENVYNDDEKLTLNQILAKY
mgnify:CR=1 FL=1